MAFLYYVAVLLVAGASVLFGLDLMTAPLPKSGPQVTATGAPASNKLERRLADQAEAKKQAHAGDDASLTPVYPAVPTGDDVRMVYPPTNMPANKPVETTGAATVAGGQSHAPEQQPVQPALATSRQMTASVEPKAQQSSISSGEPVAVEASAIPVAQPAPPACNVSACAASYRSFRHSDCTYQPYDGPRRLCTKAEGSEPSTAERGSQRHERRLRRAAELDAVERRVRELTENDRLGYRPRDREVIMIERGYFDRVFGQP